MNKIALILMLLSITFTVVECKKKKQTEEEEAETSFDKTGMLSNYSSNVIVPHIQAAKNSIDSFAVAYNNFVSNKTVQNLITARQKFVVAYKDYQKMELFNFGPAENELVSANFNTFPTDTPQVLSNITSGIYNLAVVSNLDAKGFPAIDYLLNSTGYSDTQLVSLFTNSANRVTYVSNCLADMQSKTTNIINGWAGYQSIFNNSNGSEIGSSLGVLVNNLDFQIDLMKNAKVGIPLGKKSLGRARGRKPRYSTAQFGRSIRRPPVSPIQT